MHIGRISRPSLDGPVPRLVAVLPDDREVIDLATAETQRLRRRGAEWDAAQRMSHATFPGSLTAALRGGDAFTTALEAVLAGGFEEATLAWDDVEWLTPVDPPVMRRRFRRP